MSQPALQLLAISGSARSASTNTAFLRALAALAPAYIKITVFDSLSTLPIFSPDLEGNATPHVVTEFCQQIDQSSGLIISCPEYVRAIPGGLKNAIDWLVSRDEIIHKPIALIHASHRGDDMLVSLRTVLSTVTTRFDERDFLRCTLVSKSPEVVRSMLTVPDQVQRIHAFLGNFSQFINFE